MSNIYLVPNRLSVGYVGREDATNGLLGYVVHYDLKSGELRKAKSLNSWRDKGIDCLDFDNEPTSGFIFSKNITRSWSYTGRGKTERLRVYDPRGFDIEIDMGNLMKIIEHYSIENAEIKGQLAYAWVGTNLCLLPVTSEEYKSSLIISRDSSKKYKISDLKVGTIYQCKNYDSFSSQVYLGRFFVNDSISGYNLGKKLIRSVMNSRQLGLRHIFAEYGLNGDFKYSIVNPNKILSELCILSDEELNDEIIKFEDTFSHKEFDGKVYMNIMEKGLFTKDNYNEVFNNVFTGYNTFVHYGGRTLKGRELFSRSGSSLVNYLNLNSTLITNRGLDYDGNYYVIQELLKDRTDDVLSSKELAERFLSAFTLFGGVINLNCFKGSFLNYYAEIKGISSKSELIKSDEFLDFLNSVAVEVMNQFDIFYFTGLRSTDGTFYCNSVNGAESVPVNNIAKSYEVGVIVNNELIWGSRYITDENKPVLDSDVYLETKQAGKLFSVLINQ